MMPRIIVTLMAILMLCGCDYIATDKPAALINGRWKNVTIGHEQWALICNHDGRALGEIQTFGGGEWYASTVYQWKLGQISVNDWYASVGEAQIAVEKNVIVNNTCEPKAGN